MNRRFSSCSSPPPPRVAAASWRAAKDEAFTPVAVAQDNLVAGQNPQSALDAREPVHRAAG
jgi:hypothetical protein